MLLMPHLIPIVDDGTTLEQIHAHCNCRPISHKLFLPDLDTPVWSARAYTRRKRRRLARENARWGRYLHLGQAQNPTDQRETRAPSITRNNALVGGLMGLRLLALTLLLTPATMQGTQRYYVEDGTLRWGAIRECKDGCVKNSWLGKGDSHFVPVGIDLRWKELREKAPEQMY
jgi:hypothetical protein